MRRIRGLEIIFLKTKKQQGITSKISAFGPIFCTLVFMVTFGFRISLLKMKIPIPAFLTLLTSLWIACSPAESQQQTHVHHIPDTLWLNLAENISTDISQPGVKTLAVAEDPVFGPGQRYLALDFDSLIRATWPTQSTQPSGYRINFLTNDRYNVSMDLNDVLAGGGYLALTDLGAPQGERWQPLQVGATAKDLNPFYLVWASPPAPDAARVWPYGLERIYLVKED